MSLRDYAYIDALIRLWMHTRPHYMYTLLAWVPYSYEYYSQQILFCHDKDTPSFLRRFYFPKLLTQLKPKRKVGRKSLFALYPRRLFLCLSFSSYLASSPRLSLYHHLLYWLSLQAACVARKTEHNNKKKTKLHNTCVYIYTHMQIHSQFSQIVLVVCIENKLKGICEYIWIT